MGNFRRTVYACGTEQAYQAHVRRGEPTDDACRDAHSAYQRTLRTRPEHASIIERRERRRAVREAAVEALIRRHPDEFRALLSRANDVV